MTLDSPAMNAEGADAPTAPSDDSPTQRGVVLRKLLRQPVTMTALAFILLLIVVAAFAPWIAPYGETQQQLGQGLAGISSDHLLGTDNLGRDTLSRMIFGARVTLQAAFQAVAVAAAVGIAIGMWLGFHRGRIDKFAMRIVDAGDSLPGILLAFAVIAVLGRGLTNAMLAVALIFVSTYIRLARALVIAEREKLYVEAATVSGLRNQAIMFKQILPNIAPPLIVQTAVMMGAAVLVEATLSFLGLGLDASSASWGGMLSEATRMQAVQPLLPWPPGIAITLTVLAFNLIGDGLRDALGIEKAHHARRGRLKLPLRRDRSCAPAAVDNANDLALQVRNLSVAVHNDQHGKIHLIDGIDLDIRAGECVGIVGESGSGKTTLGLAIAGLLPASAWVDSGSIVLNGRNIKNCNERELQKIRGSEVAVILQDPFSALSSVHTIGKQLEQAITNHHAMPKKQVRQRAIELLTQVGIPNPEERLGDYPHQFSGGMAQRVVIAMALAGNPRVLIADEPTTALDVTVQEEILDLLYQLRQTLGMAILLVTHDLGVVADSCDRTVVLYAGQVCEYGDVEEFFSHPRHPYAQALLAAMPEGGDKDQRLATIEGRVPLPWQWGTGCRFSTRCGFVQPECLVNHIELADGVRCIRAESALHTTGSGASQ